MEGIPKLAIHRRRVRGSFRANGLSGRTAKATIFVSISWLYLTNVVGCATGSGQAVMDAFSGFDRAAADRYVQQSQQQNALYAAQMRELAARREEREARQKLESQTEQAHQILETGWVTLGLEPPLAHAVATAYQPSAADSNILTGVRARGANSAASPMFEAIKHYDYNLADQLLLAYVIVEQEEKDRQAAEAPLPKAPSAKQ